MGTDIYKVSYEFVFGGLSQEEIYFIEENVYCSDDGTYELSEEDFGKLKARIAKFEKKYKTELKSMFKKFKEEIKKSESSHLSFRLL